MKKKLKIASIIVGIIVLCAAGYLLYIMKFKEYDVADESVDEIIGESYEIELPDGTKITLSEDGEVIEDTNGDDSTASTSGGSDDASQDEGSSSSSSNNSAGGKNDGKGTTSTGTGTTTKPTTPGKQESKPTVASIKEKYTPAFHALEGQADSKLNALVGRAKNEYLSKKENGEKIDYGYFYNKYTSAATELEGRTDVVFQGVLKAVEKDLEKSGYDKSYAKSFVEEYNASKKSRKDSLMKKVTGL